MLTLLLVLALGCAPAHDAKSIHPAAKSPRHRESRCWKKVALGVGAGALIGYVIGHDSRDVRYLSSSQKPACGKK